MVNSVHDLRSALALLAGLPGELVESDTEVDPHAELSGVYRYVGAGGTTRRPTREGPALISCGKWCTTELHTITGSP